MSLIILKKFRKCSNGFTSFPPVSKQKLKKPENQTIVVFFILAETPIYPPFRTKVVSDSVSRCNTLIAQTMNIN